MIRNWLRLHGLYWKIFLSLWLVMCLIAIATAIVSSFFIREDYERRQQSVQDRSHAESAVSVYDGGGKASLTRWLKYHEGRSKVRLYVISPEGKELLGREIPELVQQQLSIYKSVHIENSSVDAANPLVYAIESQDQGIYHVVIEKLPLKIDGSRFYRDVLRVPSFQWVLLLVAVVVIGSLSLLFSRYISTPVQKLRDATHRISLGDFSARVGSVVGHRHDVIGDLAHDFDRMAKRLESLLTAQKRMLGDISHELRSPLARLLAALGLARKLTNNIAKEELDRIEYETERLNDLIGKILLLMRMENCELDYRKETINISYLIKHIVDDANYESQQDNKRISYQGLENCWCPGNDELLHGAIENVIRNAISFTPAGSGVDVSLEYSEESQKVIIRVRDFGEGVANDALLKLFDPFYRVDTGRDRKSGGYGLGLAIASRAVAAHQGRISATNAEGGGLLIEIVLPM